MQLLDGSLPFSTASQIWLGNHGVYIKPSTLRVYRQYAGALNAFLGDIALSEIHVGHVRGFQRWRSEKACPTRVNAEVSSVLAPILKEINTWKAKIADVYRPLPVPKTKVRQNMSEEEERRLIAIALDAEKPRRLLAGHCLILMANTGMGFGELRFLRRDDVVLNEARPIVTVNEGTKNDYRIRTIPLNWIALRSMRWILRRWENLGGSEPTQYILPHHAHRPEEERKAAGHKRKSPPDFTQPMGHIYRAARGILKEAGLGHMDPYDMRSHFGTKLLSDPTVSDQMFQEIFGHGNTRTRDRYSKQRIEKKAVALDTLCLEQEPKVKLLLFSGGRK
jgi:integrase